MIPSHWRTGSLGEEVEILDSLRIPVNAAERANRVGSVPYYGASGQVGWIDEHLFNEELVLLGEDGAPFFDPARDVAYRIHGPAWVNNHAHVLRAGRRLTNRFLLHQLNQIDYRPFVSGTTRAKLPQGPMREIPLVLPPLPEQHRIVAAIETHFSRLDAAVASLTRARANVKRARASVLKAAVEGRLVPTEAALARAEGRDYEPAAVLLDRILAERKAAWAASGTRGRYQEPVKPETEGLPGLPEGWCWMSMDALLRGIEAGKSFSADNTVPGPDQVGIVKVSAVTWGVYNEDEAKTVHDPVMVNSAFFIQQGDFLISRANTIELVGAAVIAERVTRRTMLSDKILRLNMPVAYRRWVLSVLRSRHGRRQIEALATGNQESMRNIGQDRIRQIAVPLPPLAEQHRIVAEADRRLSVLDTLDLSIDADLARCARLRQAILKRAFEGRLVADADKAPAADSFPG